MAIEEGKKAPAFRLKDGNGEVHALADYAGRDVVVYFYPRDETPGCTKEACGFRDLWRDFEKLGVAVFGVSPDSPESHASFSSNHGLPFTLLSDPDRKVMTKYDAFGEKKLYGKVVEGVIRSTVWIGADGRVRKHWKRVPKAADHPQKVLDVLKASRAS